VEVFCEVVLAANQSDTRCLRQGWQHACWHRDWVDTAPCEALGRQEQE